jgi:chorismate dehydratase
VSSEPGDTCSKAIVTERAIEQNYNYSFPYSKPRTPLPLRAKINQLGKIKVGIVNYLNTKPLLFGIENSKIIEEIELVPGYPAHIASLLLENSIDIGLVPVAVIPRLAESHIVTDYCIACDGPVASVCLLSQVPMAEIEKVLIDYQSRTSANLVKILIREYWKLDVELIDTRTDYREQIKGSTAGLVIGDRCLEYRERVSYVYDLGEAWKNFTGLPFVFAAWISNKKLPDSFVEDFNAANKIGVENIDLVIAQNQFPYYDSAVYFRQNINYVLDAEKRKGLDLFLNKLSKLV